MPRASQDYSDQDYQFIKRAAHIRGQDIRAWITAAAVRAAKQEIAADAENLLKTLAPVPEVES